MTFETLRSELDDLAGLDLSTAERDRLLNEGYRRLAVESEWTRKTDDIGPTVVDQAAYAVPSDLYRGLRLAVNGVPYYLSDEEDAEQLTRGQRNAGSTGIYYTQFDSSGVESYALYPVPTVDGYAVNLTYVYRPAEMDDDADEPAIPSEFHRALVDYARGVAYGSLEDHAELEAFYLDKFARAVAELKALRVMRAGRGPAQMRVQGIHF